MSLHILTWRVPRRRALHLLIAVLGSLPALGLATDFAVGPWPTRHWRSATPESQGFDSAKLAAALDHARARRLAIHNLLIIRNRFVVLDARFFPQTSDSLHDVASVSKSITATLIGVALQQRLIDSVERSVSGYFPEYAAAADPRKARIRLASLLTMRSGLDCTFADDELTLQQMRASSDWIGFMLQRPLLAEPDTRWEYCSGGSHLLSAVLSRATGRSALDYARQRLFAVLGIREAIWPADPQGVSYGWGDLHLRPADMAKIGLLYLHVGEWDGERVLDAEFVRAAIRAHSKTHFGGGDYGYGWWVKPAQQPFEYEAVGRGGQRITVLPDLDIVIVFTGGEFEPGEIGSYIGAALKSDQPLPDNPEAFARLQSALIRAQEPPAPRALAPLPATAAAISGRTYRFEDNPLRLQTLALQFAAVDVAKLSLRYRSDTVVGGVHAAVHALGLDGVPRVSAGGRFGLSVAAEGHWQDPQRFVLNYDEIANIGRVRLMLQFEGDQVKVEARAAGADASSHFVGRAEPDSLPAPDLEP